MKPEPHCYATVWYGGGFEYGPTFIRVSEDLAMCQAVSYYDPFQHRPRVGLATVAAWIDTL